jgi:hypothetical protein
MKEKTPYETALERLEKSPLGLFQGKDKIKEESYEIKSISIS